MAVWWLCGGYVFPVLVKPEVLIFFLNQVWSQRSRSIAPQNNTDLNQGILHLWSRFGDPSLNGWWVITQTNFNFLFISMPPSEIVSFKFKYLQEGNPGISFTSLLPNDTPCFQRVSSLVIAWHRISTNPISGPMLSRVTIQTPNRGNDYTNYISNIWQCSPIGIGLIISTALSHRPNVYFRYHWTLGGSLLQWNKLQTWWLWKPVQCYWY